MLSQERLVSIFLEGLSSKELHTTLYMKHHKNLNQCIHDAIDYDDNCDDELKGKDTNSMTMLGLMDVQLFSVPLTKNGENIQLRNAIIALDS